MSGPHQHPASRDAAPSGDRQPAFSRRWIAEDDTYRGIFEPGDRLYNVDYVFSTFDEIPETVSLPPPLSPPEQWADSGLDAESSTDVEEAPPTSNLNHGISRFRELFELDSDEPAGAHLLYGETGRFAASAVAVADDEDGDDELVIPKRVRRRARHPQLRQAAAAEVESPANNKEDVNPFQFIEFQETRWFNPSGICHRNNVQEQGPDEILHRLDEVKQSSRKYEPRPTYDNVKKSEKLRPRKEQQDSVCRKCLARGWQKVKNLFKRERSQVFELEDLPKSRLRSIEKGKEPARETVTTLPGTRMTMHIERDSGPGDRFALEEPRIHWQSETEIWSSSSSTVVPGSSQYHDEDGVVAECSHARKETNPFQGNDFDPILFTPRTPLLRKPPRSGHWFSRKL